MVDPSVHPYRMNLSDSDESSSDSDFRTPRRSFGSSTSKGATPTQGKVHKSRSRTRRSSVNSAVEMNALQKMHVSNYSQPIDEDLKEQSPSASSRSESQTNSSSLSSSSEGEAIMSSPKAPSNRKSYSDAQSTKYSVDQSMQSSSKAIPKTRSNPDPYLYSESSASEDESKQSPPKATFKGKSPSDASTGKSNSDINSGTSGSEDESIKESPRPSSKGTSNSDTNSGISGSEDESNKESPKPSSNGKSNSDTNSGISGSEEESINELPRSSSKEKSNSDTNSGISGSEDESIKESPKPSSKRKSNSDTNSGVSDSEDEWIQVPPKPSSNEKSNSESNSGVSGSEDESIQEPPKPSSNGKFNSDTNSGVSGSEDESIQELPKPSSRSNSDTNTRSSSSEDESIQASPKQKSQGESDSERNSGTSSSEDKSMQSSSKGKTITNTGNYSSEDEPMQSSPPPALKGKSTPKTNTGSLISGVNSPKPTLEDEASNVNYQIGLEEDSSTPTSEDENERVLSKLSDIQIGIEEKTFDKKIPESFEVQQRKVLGDKLTAKFKVTLPEIGAGLIGGPLQFLRVPQFIPVESGAFDAETFKDSMAPDDLKDEQARGDFLNRLKTTVRWRENKDKTKESNARIVRWSDGSETFHVGSEVFDVMHHKVIDDKNHLFVDLEKCYQAQGSITDKMTLRPKLDSTFGQSHVQGLRNRAMNKPQTGVVKVLSDLVANPLTDRERRAKEEIANLRREEREKRREVQMSMRKPRVKPMRHCTADDSDPDQPAGDQEDLESETAQSVCALSIGSSNTQGIRTNRNMAVNPGRLESTDEEDEEESGGSDVDDLINDDDPDGEDEEMSEKPRTSTSKSQKAPPSRHSSKSDSDEGPKARIVKRKTKRLIYSESDSD